MRITAVTWRDLANPSAGGAEVVIDRLLKGFSARGHQVTLLCGGPLADHDYRAIKAGGTFSQYLLAPVICMTSLRRSDVIIDVENGLPYFSPLWRRRPALCMVHHVHTDQWHGRFPPFIAALCQFLESHVMPVVYRNRVFVAVSSSTAAALEAIGVPPDHIRVIESGVDVPSGPLAARSVEPLFISLNRLVPHKRVALLLDAWEIASREIPGRLLVLGDGPELEAVRHKAERIPRVEVRGYVPEELKTELLAQAWGIVSAAHHEGWGISVMEAAAFGTPALAVDAPGIKDAIVGGVTGVLVEGSGEELAFELAKAWVAFARDEGGRERMGVAARERAAQFAWDQTIDRWLSVLQEVKAPGPSPQRLPGVAPLASVARGGQTPSPAVTPTGASDIPASGLRRSIRLFKAFRTEFDDPDGFYTYLADDTVALVGDYHAVSGQRVLDVGGGPGYFAEAFRRAGAESVFVEPFWDSLTDRGTQLGYGILGDGLRLPFPDCSFDIAHSSNVIEHVRDPRTFLDEMVRVVRPDGLVFMAFTNWFSPFGGHETSPWHYLGGDWAARRYERRHGYPAKNRFGVGLFPLHIGQVLDWGRTYPGVEVLDAFPRYYPRWARPILKVPGLRELASWNLALVLRRSTVPPVHTARALGGDPDGLFA